MKGARLVSSSFAARLSFSNNTLSSPLLAGMDSSIDLTPRDDDDARIFKYYCPLCMCHFANTTYQPCCSNYTCYSCAVSYLQSKGVLSPDDYLLPMTVPRWLDCCHCTQSLQDTMFIPVNSDDDVKSYQDDEAYKHLRASLVTKATSSEPEDWNDIRRKVYGNLPSSSPPAAGVGGISDDDDVTNATALSSVSSSSSLAGSSDLEGSIDLDDSLEPDALDGASRLFLREDVHEVIIEEVPARGGEGFVDGFVRGLISAAVGNVGGTVAGIVVGVGVGEGLTA